MDALVVGATLVGSFLGAFVVQRAALQGLLRMMQGDRRGRR